MPRNDFFLRPKAEQYLEAIYQYGYQEFGVARAEQYIKNLDKAFHTLAKSPKLGRKYSYVREGLLAYPLISHIIFFRQYNNGIIIVRVLHQSMDYLRHFS